MMVWAVIDTWEGDIIRAFDSHEKATAFVSEYGWDSCYMDVVEVE